MQWAPVTRFVPVLLRLGLAIRRRVVAGRAWQILLSHQLGGSLVELQLAVRPAGRERETGGQRSGPRQWRLHRGLLFLHPPGRDDDQQLRKVGGNPIVENLAR